MKWNRVSRRLVLQGAGGAFLTLPWLESIAPKEAQAAGPPAKRFIALKTYNHPSIPRWYPAMQGGNYSLKRDGTTRLSQRIEPNSGYTTAPLSDFVQPGKGISAILGPFLNKFLPKMNLIRGLDFLPDTNHNYSAWLGNYSSCDEATPVGATLALPKWPTIDQVLAHSPKFYAKPPPERSLHVGQGQFRGVQWTESNGRVTQGSTTTNPVDAFNKLFAGFMGMGGASMDDGRQLRDANVVNKVYGDYAQLKNSKRMSTKDKQLLDQFATLFQDLNNRLKTQPTATCAKPGAPASSPGNNRQDRADIKAKWEAFIDIIVAAIMCDRTRVVTMDVRKVLTAGGALFHNPDGVGGSWHGSAHRWGISDPYGPSGITEGHAWAAENIFLKLMEKLDVPEEGGRTYLDNSLIYWGGELGFNHINYSVICLLAGSAGGYLKTGRYMDYIDWNGKTYFGQMGGTVIKGIPHNQFCNTVLQAMGLSPADYERSGVRGFGERRTTNKNPDRWATDYDFGKIGQVLPGITA
jgi:hypothetical protein